MEKWYTAEFYGPCGLFDMGYSDESLEEVRKYCEESIASEESDHARIVLREKYSGETIWTWEREEKTRPACEDCMYWNGTECTCDGEFMVHVEDTAEVVCEGEVLEKESFDITLFRGEGFEPDEWETLMAGGYIMRKGSVRKYWLWEA